MTAAIENISNSLSRANLSAASGAEVRAAVRAGRWTRATHGLARGYVQANLAILPEAYAYDFLLFAQRNPKPCPIIEVTETGNPEPSFCAPGADIRNDLPGYRVFRNGQLVEERRSIADLWRKDHVAFLIGCSNSMDEALEGAGIRQRHLETEDGRISVYTSSIQCRSAGRLHGPVVVTMRPIPYDRVEEAREISSRYPLAHGSPLHVGDPAAIGIPDLSNVEWGRFNALRENDVPVFWACGVTPQAIAIASGIPEMITHAAGHMFVTDILLGETRT
ncbi:putative hydro-lyase [Xanthomonas campestris pv. phormiicola]|nr:putative hydro-lyase [Xanthomonas campestris pv. phormiicola]UYC17388.1 putative hydro-lyase [Xanthomonas campestris pv. phormiicola]